MKTAALTLLMTLASASAFAGSDSLHCSSTDGKYAIAGSIWGHYANLMEMKKTGDVIEVEEKAAVVDIVDSEADLKKATDDASKDLLSPKNKDWYRSVYVLSTVGEPNYTSQYEGSGCRDVGSSTYTQSMKVVRVHLEEDYKTNKTKAVVESEGQTFSCYYHYATAPGGGPECGRP